MADPSDFLGTPANYATPAQLASMRDYAAALQKQSMSGDTKHWLQGVSHMVEALMGGYLGRQADVREARERLSATQAAIPSFSAPTQSPRIPGPHADAADNIPSPPAPVASAAPSPPGTVASVRNNNPGAQWPGPISTKWGATGAQDLPGGQKIATFDDPVKGAAAHLDLLGSRYAGMPLSAALDKWSGSHNAGTYTARVARETGLDPSTPITPELLRSPQGVALAKAMARHEAGGNYPLSDEQWSVAQNLAFGGGAAPRGPALAFTGEPIPAMMPPAMPGGAPSPGRPTLPADETPQPISAPGAPALPPAAQDTVRALMNPGPVGTATPAPSPAASPPGPQLAQNAVSPAMPGGQAIHGTFVPPEAFPRRTQYTAQQLAAVMNNPFADPALKAQVWQLYQQQQQPLSMPYKGVGTIIANPQDPRQQSFIPEVRTFKEKTGEIEREVPYTYDIRTERWVPVPMGANSGGTSPAPLGAGGVPIAPPAAGASAPAPGRAPFTGNAPGPLLEDLTGMHAERKRRESQAAEDVKQYGNLHTGLAGAGLTASDQLPYIQIAKGILDDPNFYSGTGSDAIMLLRRAGAGLGVLPATAATPMEAFNKVMAANILQQVNSLRAQQESMGSQSGRIFQSQIELMEKAAQNPANTVAANRYLTQLAEWSANRSRKIADMADDYKIKHGALDANFEKSLRGALSTDPDLRLPKSLQFPEAEAAKPPGALGTAPPPALPSTPANIAAAKAELARRQQQQAPADGSAQP